MQVYDALLTGAAAARDSPEVIAAAAGAPIDGALRAGSLKVRGREQGGCGGGP